MPMLARDDERTARYGCKAAEARGGFGHNSGSPVMRQGLRSAAVYFDGVGNSLVRSVLAVGHQKWTNREACGERREEIRKEKEEEEEEMAMVAGGVHPSRRSKDRFCGWLKDGWVEVGETI